MLIVASFAESLVNFRGPFIQSLLKKGVHVDVAAPFASNDKELLNQLRVMGVKAHDVPLSRAGINPLKDVVLTISLSHLMRKQKYDVIFAYTVKPVVYGVLAAWLVGVPKRYALITGLGYVFTGKAKGIKLVLKTMLLSLYKLSLQRSTLVFFQNPDDQSVFRNLGLLKTKVPSCVVNGSGIDTKAFDVTQLPSNTSFLLIARLLGDKGVREYVQAARIVKRHHPSITFHIVGWLDENPDAIQQDELDSWIAEGVIVFCGKLSDVRPAIEKCSVYVLPSYREGTPRTVLEAMAMGRPIITSDAPGCRETVKDGDNGYLVPVKSVDALVIAMQRFIDNPALFAKMGARSRQIAEEKYDVRMVNAVMLREMGIGE